MSHREIAIGGGFSNAETVGALADFLRASRRYYRSLAEGEIRVHLVHSGERLLPELSPSLGKLAARRMHEQRIDVELNARVVRVDDRGVMLADGEALTGV